MHKIYKLALVLSFLFPLAMEAQNVSINKDGSTPHSSSMLDISATDAGILIPRMTQAQRLAIATPAEGLLVYQTDATETFYYFNGTVWNYLSDTQNTWNTLGNTGLLDLSNNYLGTVDNVPLNFLVNNRPAGRIDFSTRNVFHGVDAGKNTTGIGNSYFGYSAGANNATGTFNTVIGSSANVGTGSLSNATAIGYSAIVNRSNSLILGGTGVNAVNVGIGTDYPNSTLQVVGNVSVGQTNSPTGDFQMEIWNGSGLDGLVIQSGEVAGDIGLSVQDQDTTFVAFEIEMDKGHVTFGKSYAQTLIDNGVVYGIDNQNNLTSPAQDFNTLNGVYRIAGTEISPYNISSGIINNELLSTTSTSTSSTSYTQIAGTNSTPAAGTYFVSFSASGRGTSDNQEMQVSLNKNGTKVAHSERDYGWEANNTNEDKRFAIHTQALITVNGSENIEARYTTNTGTFNLYERSIIVIKVAD